MIRASKIGCSRLPSFSNPIALSTMNIDGYRLTKAFYAEVDENEDMQTR
jgi:hypothetical protein